MAELAVSLAVLGVQRAQALGTEVNKADDTRMTHATSSVSGEGLRIIHLAGPGDAPAVLRNMAAGLASDGVAHVAYSRQVFEVALELGADLLSVSTHHRRDDFSFGRLRAVSRPDLLGGKAGLGFHWANFALARELERDVAEFGANVVITVPSPYPFLLRGLSASGTHVVPALHAILWPEFTKPSLLRRLAVQLSRRFYADTCPAILSHPGGAVRQVMELTGGHPRPIVEFLPLYRRDVFARIAAPQPEAGEFRVITVGRVEANKGVFALIEVARRLREIGLSTVRFDVCGAGSALEEARRRVASLGLDQIVRLHGWTEMNELERLWGESHVAVVPTTSDFVEGFNQVVIEAMLAGRPVVTSRVCPALDFVRPCAIEVDVDDVEGYVAAVADLARNRDRYRALQARTGDVAAQFLDERNSFGAALRHLLQHLVRGEPVPPVARPPTY